MFGTPQTRSNKLQGLTGVLHRAVRDTRALAAEGLSQSKDASSILAELSALADPARAALDALPTAEAWAERDSLTVVLMGRTTAGKSTLLEALANGDGSRQGRGGQRTTREVHSADAADLPNVVLVDTPGVGAHDGKEDWEAAFAQVPAADLILWVAANDSHQEETTRALRHLALQGKPIVMALNCRYPIDGLDGALNTSGRVFLKHPSLAFDEAEDHARVLARHMAQAGVPKVSVVPVHARAAYLATTGIDQAANLRSASRIEDLIAVLATHRESTQHAQLRALRSVDLVREPLVSTRVHLHQAICAAQGQVKRHRGMVADADRRMCRAIDREEAQLKADLAKPIDVRRKWHLGADPGKGVQEAWKAEATNLGEELDGIFKRAAEQMQRALEDTLDQTAQDWSDIPMPDLDDVSLTKFDSVLWHRIGKVGVTAAGGLLAGVAVASAQGAVVGSLGGPIGTVLGAAAGALAGAVVGELGSRVARWFGSLFKSEAEVRQERRQQLGEALKRSLDELSKKASEGASELASAHRLALRKWRRTTYATLAEADRQIVGWQRLEQYLAVITSSLDLTTAQVLLEAAGRTRAAGGAVRAVRGPSALAVEMTEPAFSEVALFPVSPSPIPMVVAPDHSSMTSGQALNLMAQLAPGQARCVRLTPDAAVFEVAQPGLDDGVLHGWEALLSDFTRTRVAITNSGTDATPGSDPRREPGADEGAEPRKPHHTDRHAA